MKRLILALFVSVLLAADATAQATRDQLLNKYVFDVDYYLLRNPDIRAAFGNDKAAATEHWINSGFYESRRGSLYFHVGNYAYYNGDLAKAFGTFSELYLDHFLDQGLNEGRQSSFYYSGQDYL